METPTYNAGTGLFITFEGGDGAGKSTQATLLAQWLNSQGWETVITREPGGTELGQEIRRLLLHEGHVDPRAEALLYAADRAHHIAEKVAPALAQGKVVIGDRYFDSSIAYQGVARQLNKNEIRQISLWAVQGLVPHLTILLDIPVHAGGSRVGAVKDRLEKAGDEFHQAVRQEFLALAEAEPQRIKIIDATQSITEIATQIQELVRPLL